MAISDCVPGDGPQMYSDGDQKCLVLISTSHEIRLQAQNYACFSFILLSASTFGRPSISLGWIATLQSVSIARIRVTAQFTYIVT